MELSWRKSSHSGSELNCVEVAFASAATFVRDSKNPTGPALLLDQAAFTTFLNALKIDCLS